MQFALTRAGYPPLMPATSPNEGSPARATFPSLQWWLRDREGKVVLAQPPNPPILVWLASVVVGWTDLVHGDRAVIVTRIGQGALVAWSFDELVRGASPARRVLGGIVLCGLLVRLFG